MTIGSIQYKDRGISIGVVLHDGAKQAIAYGECVDVEALKSELQTTFPGIRLYDRIYEFRKACDAIGANAWPELKREEPPVQKFAQWERVQWGEQYALVTSASLIAGRWVYTVEPEGVNGSSKAAVESDLKKAEQLPPAEEVVIDASYKKGAIVSWHGHSYQVVSNVYVSRREAIDLEDANDMFDAAGYHCRLRLQEE